MGTRVRRITGVYELRVDASTGAPGTAPGIGRVVLPNQVTREGGT
jgi:hypothetical protein